MSKRQKLLSVIGVNNVMIYKQFTNAETVTDINGYLRMGGKVMPLLNHLKEYRARINVNQQEMGRLVGVSRQTISQIERGDYSPSVTLALKIAKVFEVRVEDIFDYVEDKDNE